MQNRGMLTWSGWVPCSRNEGGLLRRLAAGCGHPTTLNALRPQLHPTARETRENQNAGANDMSGWSCPLWRLSYDPLRPNPGSGRPLSHGVRVGAFRRAEPVARAADALDQHAAALVHRQLLAQVEDKLIHAAVLWLPGTPQRGLGQSVA